MENLPQLKLFMVLLGSKAPERNVEQHDYFFGIAACLKDLVEDFKAFWPESGNSLHIDGWREVTYVDGHSVEIAPKSDTPITAGKRLFFINLGGYTSGKLEEQHYIMLTVQDDRIPAVKDALKTAFYKTNSVKGAHSHIDEKYGVDVDDVYRIEDILSPKFKQEFDIILRETEDGVEDIIHLGYFKMKQVEMGEC
ncbi:DUF1543 domain-containing protein [Mucilaginibacter ginkgonis]|uniref:DUF1543 domain-containing protein n=1 Tax=Mucilaginibacter ginkgonis TaxID=2682091 RepID=A0A6I4HUT9_9SPHI|nr:DUF1543 domain-containing protein [Mucilaginibacter ginkgonis]QQL50312.1 DUF1543 domain-containing protein [Mucilaginibacter ginkgonis]